jgi:hypothetical protein
MIVHWALFIIPVVSPAPIIEPLESDVVPIHVPVIVGEAVGAVGEELPEPPEHAAALTAAARMIATANRMFVLQLKAVSQTQTP